MQEQFFHQNAFLLLILNLYSTNVNTASQRQEELSPGFNSMANGDSALSFYCYYIFNIYNLLYNLLKLLNEQLTIVFVSTNINNN